MGPKKILFCTLNKSYVGLDVFLSPERESVKFFELEIFVSSFVKESLLLQQKDYII